jgi:hypothetical protein
LAILLANFENESCAPVDKKLEIDEEDDEDYGQI